MNPKTVLNIVQAAVCLIAAGLYVDEAIRSVRDDKWDKAIRSEVPESANVPDKE